jgi:AraC-like DNA-binding protein
MKKAGDDIRYVMIKDHYKSVLSLFLDIDPNFIFLIYPLFFNGAVHVGLFSRRGLSVNSKESLTDNPIIYVLQIEKNPSSFMQTLLEYYMSGKSVFKLLYEENRLVEKLLNKLFQENHKSEQHKMKQLYLKILLQHLLEILDRDAAFDSRDVLLVKEFYKLLNYDGIPNRKVKYYADKLYVSRRYLTRAVHKISGETPKTFIDGNLIEKAKLLLDTQNSIYIIAEELQFESHASFATFFKKHTGLSPSAYRSKKNS